MKKLNLITAISLATVGYFVINGYKQGPASYAGWDCTGAETGLSNPVGCFAFTGCHSSAATTGIAVTLELDSVGIPTTSYVGGMNYTIKITGINNTSSTLPAFGFQMGSIIGSTAQVTPINAGTWPSPYPTNTHYAAPQPSYYVVGVVENSNQLAPKIGTGGNGTTYVEVINWTAPPKATGTVSIWAALNAVDNNNLADTGDKWNTTHVIINENVLTGIGAISENNAVKVYPNPTTALLNIEINGQTDKTYIELYNMLGEKILARSLNNGLNTINLGHRSAGIYLYRLFNTQAAQLGEGKIMVE